MGGSLLLLRVHYWTGLFCQKIVPTLKDVDSASVLKSELEKIEKMCSFCFQHVCANAILFLPQCICQEVNNVFSGFRSFASWASLVFSCLL